MFGLRPRWQRAIEKIVQENKDEIIKDINNDGEYCVVIGTNAVDAITITIEKYWI